MGDDKKKKSAPIPDKPELHPQRTLCYHFKAAHDALAQHVGKGNISFDTPLEFEVEHCTTKRPVWHCTQRSVHARCGQGCRLSNCFAEWAHTFCSRQR